MKPPLSVFANAGNLNSSAFADSTAAELSTSLLEWFCLWETRPEVLDNDVIANAGLLVGDSSFEDIDRIVLNWITSQYSTVRLEIGADFLSGYWRTTKIVDATAVAPFIALLQQVEVESWAFASGVYALYRLTGNADLSDTARQQVQQQLLVFRETMIRNGIHKGVSQSLVGL